MQLFFNRNTEPAIMGPILAWTPGAGPRWMYNNSSGTGPPVNSIFAYCSLFGNERSECALPRHRRNQSIYSCGNIKAFTTAECLPTVGPYFLLRGEQA